MSCLPTVWNHTCLENPKQKTSDQNTISRRNIHLRIYPTDRWRKDHLTGRPFLTIPDFATAILSKEPPSASRCSSPTVVMIDIARSEPEITLVASRAPPNPAYMVGRKYKMLMWARVERKSWFWRKRKRKRRRTTKHLI